jgi:hypothetical protein
MKQKIFKLILLGILMTDKPYVPLKKIDISPYLEGSLPVVPTYVPSPIPYVPLKKIDISPYLEGSLPVVPTYVPSPIPHVPKSPCVPVPRVSSSYGSGSPLERALGSMRSEISRRIAAGEKDIDISYVSPDGKTKTRHRIRMS